VPAGRSIPPWTSRNTAHPGSVPGDWSGENAHTYGELVRQLNRVEALNLLASRARSGDPEAVEAFVDASYEQVWRLCSALVDEGTADDLAQETFVRAVGALPRFGARSSARTWLLAIARHVCLDELRSRGRRRRRDAELVALGAAGPEAPDSSQQVAVVDLLRHLEPERRGAFVLTQFLGLRYAEAAAVCECPEGTIRSRVARARADLLELLGARPEYGRDESGRRSPSA
jgi:RNA polymerase sigma-70 factor (ECF subfamily)